METIEIKCKNCEKNVYVIKEFMREKTFCTLRRLSDFKYKEGDMKGIALSVIIPAYNEEARIEKTLQDYSKFFNNIEIFVAIAGNDRTLDIVKKFSENGNGNLIMYLHSEKRLGKGMGLLNSFDRVNGDIIAITDADGSTSPSEIYKLVNQLDGCDCVIGSRWLPESKILTKQPLKRRIASRCFNYIVRHTLDIPFRDTQCGAKVFRKEAIKYATDRISTYDYAFDIDLLYQLHKNGFKIKEVPMTWNDEEGSSVKLFRTSIVMFLSVIRLRMINSNFRFLIKNNLVGSMYEYMKGQK